MKMRVKDGWFAYRNGNSYTDCFVGDIKNDEKALGEFLDWIAIFAGKPDLVEPLLLPPRIEDVERLFGKVSRWKEKSSCLPPKDEGEQE